MRSMRTMTTSAFFIALALGASMNASAQQATGDNPVPVATAPSAAPNARALTGPTLTAAARLDATAPTTDAAARNISDRVQSAAVAAPVEMTVRRAPNRQNMALMIVGGVGLLVGAAIGGDGGNLIMIGSGVVGLYGLYQYLR